MKNLLLALLLSVPFYSFAEANLDGEKFCRTVVRDGFFGQPAGEAQHCVSFEAGMMSNNANTFFGNPPEVLPYRITADGIVETEQNGVWVSEYVIEEKTLVNLDNLNQVLVLVEKECN